MTCLLFICCGHWPLYTGISPRPVCFKRRQLQSPITAAQIEFHMAHRILLYRQVSRLWLRFKSMEFSLTNGLATPRLVTINDDMMTSSKGTIFRVAGPLFGELTGNRRIPPTKARDAKLWCFLWCAPEQTVEQTIETPVIWDAITVIGTLLLSASPWSS